VFRIIILIVQQNYFQIRIWLNFFLDISTKSFFPCTYLVRKLIVSNAWNDFSNTDFRIECYFAQPNLPQLFNVAVNTLRARADDNAHVRSLIFIKLEVTCAPLFESVTSPSLCGFNRFSPWQRRREIRSRQRPCATQSTDSGRVIRRIKGDFL